MEVTLDIGKYMAKQISDIANSEQEEFDIVALKILDLGLRIYKSSLDTDNQNSTDPILLELLNQIIENNYLLKETLGHVFIKERSTLKTYDATSAITVAKNMAKSFVDGRKTM